MFLCKCNYVIFWQTNKLLANAKLVFKIFFSLFLPGAGLQINTEYARKLLNYSCTKLFKCSWWERQSPWIYLLAQKQCVIHRQRRGFSAFVLFTCQYCVSRWSISKCILNHLISPQLVSSFLSPNSKDSAPSVIEAGVRDTHYQPPRADIHPSSTPQVKGCEVQWRKDNAVKNEKPYFLPSATTC